MYSRALHSIDFLEGDDHFSPLVDHPRGQSFEDELCIALRATGARAEPR